MSTNIAVCQKEDILRAMNKGGNKISKGIYFSGNAKEHATFSIILAKTTATK